jgi:acyl-CoA thioesterase-1
MRTASFALAFVFAVASAVAGHAETIRIVAIGDSNIAGKGVSASQAYPAALQRALRAKGYDVVVRNAGVNGNTTSDVLARLDSSVPPGTQVAIVAAGANDRAAGVSEGTVQANLHTIARRLQQRGIAVMTLPRFQGSLFRRPELHVEPAGSPKNRYHLNAAGYRQAAARDLPRVIALIKQAQRRHH